MLHKLIDWVLKDERRRAWVSRYGLELASASCFLAGVVWTLLALCISGRLP